MKQAAGSRFTRIVQTYRLHDRTPLLEIFGRANFRDELPQALAEFFSEEMVRC